MTFSRLTDFCWLFLMAGMKEESKEGRSKANEKQLKEKEHKQGRSKEGKKEERKEEGREQPDTEGSRWKTGTTELSRATLMSCHEA